MRPETAMLDRAYICEHLGANPQDERDIVSFVTRGKGNLAEYLRYNAFPDESSGKMRTYLVRDRATSELVCYFSLKAGLVSLSIEDESIDTVPGIELANFAVNSNYIRVHPEAKGVGQVIFQQEIVPIVEKAAAIVGAKLIYIFALPEESLIQRYTDYGFTRLPEIMEEDLHRRIKPLYDEDCIFMYQSL